MIEWSTDDIKVAVRLATTQPVKQKQKLSPTEIMLIRLIEDATTPQTQKYFSVLSNLSRLFLLRLQKGPDLFLAGGVIKNPIELATSSVTGTGSSSGDALWAIAGETAEVMSRWPVQNIGVDNLRYTKTANYLKPALQKYICRGLTALGFEACHETRVLEAKHLTTGAVEPYPEILCRRLGKPVPGWAALSEGCAAHWRESVATQNALCERLERHAAALWWSGIRPPIKPTTSHLTIFEQIVGQQNIGLPNREHKLLNLSIEWGPAVFAAISYNRDGRDITIGLGCDVSTQAAIQRAFKEMRQMEFSLFLIRKKLKERGIASLQRTERAALARANLLHASQDSRFHYGKSVQVTPTWTAIQSVREIAEHAFKNNVDLYKLSLKTNLHNMAVIKVVSPQLRSVTLGNYKYHRTRLNDNPWCFHDLDLL